ncbi:MAG: DUF4112 domain-containing protein [Pleurocapsa sp.]
MPAKKLSQTNKVDRLRRLSQILDNAIPIPGTKYRLGLDPILGLLPGGGDTITGALGAYIIIEAAKMGLPRKVIGEMVGNIIFDSLAGTIPVIGDLFDIGWKANVKNITLLEKHLQLTPQKRKTDVVFVIGLTVFLALIVLGFATLTFWMIRWLLQQVS